jgi:co-chaperonin GroES (HSP10)
MPDIATDFSENIIWVGAAGFEAHADRLIILQDDYRSGFECKTCLDEGKRTVNGKEVSTISCEECKGSGRRLKAGNASLTVKCSDCEGEGWKICPDCGGKGGAIVIPEKEKGKPTTGTIVSIGPEVQYAWKRGDKCIYPSFAGHAYDLEGLDQKRKVVKVTLVILRDSEILSRMVGALEQNQVKRSAALHTVA